DGSAFGAYASYPSVVTTTGANDPTLTQAQFRWYANITNAQPSTPLAGQNVGLAQATATSVFRLRMNIGVANQNLTTGSEFKLQYATSTSGPWTDVDGLTGSATWRGHNNAAVTDGVAV